MAPSVHVLPPRMPAAAASSRTLSQRPDRPGVPSAGPRSPCRPLPDAAATRLIAGRHGLCRILARGRGAWGEHTWPTRTTQTHKNDTHEERIHETQSQAVLDRGRDRPRLLAGGSAGAV